MKIAIHHKPHSFSERWIEYCKEKGIPYKIVNAYDSDIVKQVEDCDAFMWHHHHADYRDALFAKQLLYSLETGGKKVFPDFHTGWHFDDKVGQKYLLESIGAPLVPSYVFYTKQEALDWVNKTSFPKVFKLRGGAGAANVRLVHSKSEAKKLIRKAFGRGFTQFDRWGYFKEKLNKWRRGKAPFIEVCKGVARLFIGTKFAKLHAPEKGYAYFQDFIPNQKFDVRLIVINQEKAYGLKRLVRKGDFRASGSGQYQYDTIDNMTLKTAFEVAKKLNLQSVAFDFVYNEKNLPLIIEMSYCFGTTGSGKCRGYWDKDLNYHEEHFNPQGWMVDEMLKYLRIENKKSDVAIESDK